MRVGQEQDFRFDSRMILGCLCSTSFFPSLSRRKEVKTTVLMTVGNSAAILLGHLWWKKILNMLNRLEMLKLASSRQEISLFILLNLCLQRNLFSVLLDANYSQLGKEDRLKWEEARLTGNRLFILLEPIPSFAHLAPSCPQSSISDSVKLCLSLLYSRFTIGHSSTRLDFRFRVARLFLVRICPNVIHNLSLDKSTSTFRSDFYGERWRYRERDYRKFFQTGFGEEERERESRCSRSEGQPPAALRHPSAVPRPLEDSKIYNGSEFKYLRYLECISEITEGVPSKQASGK